MGKVNLDLRVAGRLQPRKGALAKARAALKEARAARAAVKQARADLKAHRGERELNIYRKALKDRRDKTVLQKWRCVHDGPP